MIAGTLLFFLAACASAPPKVTFDLTPVRGARGAGPARGQLAVAVPQAISPENSDRIVVRTDSQSISYLSGAQWADRLPALVQNRLIESFQDAHVLRAVGRPGMRADFTLETAIRRFEFDSTRGAVNVEIEAQLASASGRVAASRLFTAVCPAASGEPEAVAAALNLALEQVMRDMVFWAAPKV